MPSKPADTVFPVHPLIEQRWSPRSFSDRPVPDGMIGSLLEAARWAPSAFNEQPWSFIVADRQDAGEFERMLECLLPSNRRWAGGAAVLMLTFAKAHFTRNGKPNRHALHDLGLAVGSMVTQATALGLGVHQMAGIDPPRILEEYAAPEDWTPVTAVAVGFPGAPENLPDDLMQRELAQRQRKPLSEIAFGTSWGVPVALRTIGSHAP